MATRPEGRGLARWVKRVLLTALVAAIVILASPLLPAGLVIGGFAVLLKRHIEAAAIGRFQKTYAPEARDLLLVYSNSPHWKDYVEWLPKWRARAVVLNSSERRQRQPTKPEVRLFRELIGGGGFSREYNPVAIVVPPQGRRVDIVRFWRAFRDYKHGRPRRLREAEAQLERALSAVDRAAPFEVPGR